MSTSKWYTVWFEIVSDSVNGGEQFFTELKSDDIDIHKAYAEEIFPDEIIACLGFVTASYADWLGYDTY